MDATTNPNAERNAAAPLQDAGRRPIAQEKPDSRRATVSPATSPLVSGLPAVASILALGVVRWHHRRSGRTAVTRQHEAPAPKVGHETCHLGSDRDQSPVTENPRP